MNMIWKCPLQENEPISVKAEAILLCLQLQNDAPYLWFLVDTEKPAADRHFVVVGTGQLFDAKGLSYVGTYQEPPFVWHVWEKLL